jgi:hypothetical protein
MVFIATFNNSSVIWWLSVLSLHYISNLIVEKYNNLRSWEIDKNGKNREIMGEINICALGS